MHNLCFLLAGKTQSVFNSSVLRTCIDQNWDLKGMKAVLLEILLVLEITDSNVLKKVAEIFDKSIQYQNHNSKFCASAMALVIKNLTKPIVEDDLKNPIATYQTTFEFLKDDIEQFRS